ncbi:alpha N-terminal protein methyltransferase 1-like isoform X5 [Cucurbita moschata]|uniref:Alpha N-terminal protein methyltransferase 1 n=2 Tax=Cucurbita moschata TaxID=3662 RepID=A0A6J1EE86_CUCMO|nr:alpha N-terminal protein methyltransferase 1-like isoform X5 [Cucurbita moschata]
MEVSGADTDGHEFKNAEEMWMEQVGNPTKRTQWYREGLGYWQGLDASVDGVLGGYGYVNDTDIMGSEVFLKSILAERFPFAGKDRPLVALDCGSGIGRVTKNLLIRYFNEVDLVEPVSHFLEAARQSLAPENNGASDVHKPANFFCVPLQEFTPDAGRYDVIWVQWCIGHLTDDDFISFFRRAKLGLKAGGIFILKENIAKSGFILDKEDRSITRSDVYYKDLFHHCGLYAYKSRDQTGFPEELFPVKMYALTTEAPNRISRTKREQTKPLNVRIRTRMNWKHGASRFSYMQGNATATAIYPKPLSRWHHIGVP